MGSKLWMEQELLSSAETDYAISEIYEENFLSVGKIESILKLRQIFNWSCWSSFISEIDQNSMVTVNRDFSEFIVICSEPRDFLPSVNPIAFKYFKCDLL